MKSLIEQGNTKLIIVGIDQLCQLSLSFQKDLQACCSCLKTAFAASLHSALFSAFLQAAIDSRLLPLASWMQGVKQTVLSSWNCSQTSSLQACLSCQFASHSKRSWFLSVLYSSMQEQMFASVSVCAFSRQGEPHSILAYLNSPITSYLHSTLSSKSGNRWHSEIWLFLAALAASTQPLY